MNISIPRNQFSLFNFPKLQGVTWWTKMSFVDLKTDDVDNNVNALKDNDHSSIDEENKGDGKLVLFAEYPIIKIK